LATKYPKSEMEEESIFDILDLHPTMTNVSFNLTDDSDPAAGNFSEFIFPPEKEGSPYIECASIVWKSDLKVINHYLQLFFGIVLIIHLDKLNLS